MSDDKFRKTSDAATRLAELREGKKPIEPTEEEGDVDAFSTISADRQQKVMLELRLKTDDAQAFPYSYLVRARFNPTNGILLDFGVAEARISGLNLRPLYAGLVAQRVAVIQEMDELHAEASVPPEATVVTRIEIMEPEE